uniref:NADH-ubiquinone oxidoreductase chain 1 n=1 Tax=Aacanthocnema dobsoni TaxID=399255 RepID=A0A344A206_9HEMI|nr:NADH dehydrogenase subunit 1 [Aacanthocnema dobsoni]AWU48797.1 NADH dehydrogenase subunit 1 [Aacanthocnema dobsoni]
MLMNFISLFLMFLFSLISVAFLTLLERKILGYVQIRKGPNKVGIYGIFQPFSDAIKLFSKEFLIPLKSNFYPYWFSPLFTLYISSITWVVFPYMYVLLAWKYSIVLMISMMSMSVYSIMVSGWSSNSSYSLLGCIRVVAQSISYEVSFFLLIFCLLYLISSLILSDFNMYQDKVWFIIVMFPVFIMMFVSILAELNRTPFDFSEGESELVSGFNIEFGSSGFAFIFLGEYLSILFSSLFLSYLFMGLMCSMQGFMKLIFISFLIIVIRGSLPRYRYDKLMNLCWKSYLSSSLFLIIFYSSMFL